MALNTAVAGKPAWHRIRTWFIGLLLLSGSIFLLSHFTELEHFSHLLRQAEPAWLVLALLLQAATYVSTAGVWQLALRQEGHDHSLRSLVPLGVAKLFSDQVMPSAGMSGAAFLVAVMSRRLVPVRICMAMLLLSLVTYYGAYMGAVFVSVAQLWYYHALQVWIIAVVIIFCLFAVGVPAGALWMRSLGSKELPAFLLKIPGVRALLGHIASAPRELLRSPALIISAALLSGSVFVLDAATLWVMLQVVGISVSFGVAFPSFVLASMVTTIGPIPLGLGAFEVTSVSMLGALGVGIEAALTATLLLRGFTMWMPILPGMWLARRALR
jgi:hypothetical protein